MRWLLDATPIAPAEPLVLDEQQQRVVQHRSGPMLVLAGPGTGKTSTLVEAVAARIAEDRLDPTSVLGLSFGRKAATDLRDRVAARLGGGVLPTVATFHSFAYALLRQTSTEDEYQHPARLMSGAEEDVRIRELLRGAVADGRVEWPEDLMAALPTLGLANEVRAVLARARELGLEGDDLERIGRAAGRPTWAAVGQLAREDQEVMALENVMDYSELILRAVIRAREPHVAADLHARYRAIYVDEYQDTDPLQVALLRAIVGTGASLVAVGDPDQAIYRFRGADVRGLLDFPRQFRDAAGSPAPVVVLRHARRFGPTIRACANAVLGDRGVAGLSAERIREHRAPQCRPVADEASDVVDVVVYDGRGAQAAHIAHGVREAHVVRKRPWSELAVLVRSSSQLPPLRRALAAAGVPVTIAADEIPLRLEPSVAALLSVVALAVSPDRAGASEVTDVLCGPIIGLGPTDLRRLGRSLRQRRRVAGEAVPASEDLIRDVVLECESPTAVVHALDRSDTATDAVVRLRRLLAQLRTQADDGELPYDVLWTAWTGGTAPHGWPSRLRAAAVRGSRAASHDIDAVMALFDAADRMSGHYAGHVGIGRFLDALADQQIPAESVADRGGRADAVRVLTAHRAKGLEWDEVWIVGVEEGVWPDIAPRGSTLRAHELTREGIGEGPSPAELLEDERRLFYVACTRARHAVHVTAVDEHDDGGDRPSRFIDDLTRSGHITALRVLGRPGAPLSLDGLVARLRATLLDPDASASMRAAAAGRLKALAAETDANGKPLVPLAHPAAWWGVLEPTVGPRPVRDPEAPLALSGSGLDRMLACPLQWFLEHEVRAETASQPATQFGSIVHAVADFVAKGEIPDDLDAMDEQVERVWGELRFEAPWQAAAERVEARSALQRFLTYHQRHERELVTTEIELHAEIDVPLPDGGRDAVRLRGFIDRLERNPDGRLVAVDLKNMRTPPPNAQIAGHGQLGVYQLLVRENEAQPPGGAALVQLRASTSAKDNSPKHQVQDALPDESPTWVEVRLGAAANVIRTEVFPAVRGAQCRYCAFERVCPTGIAGAAVIE